MNDDRFINIETKILHQDRLLEELHQALYEQQDRINNLEKKLKQFEDMSNSEGEIRPANEKPPHY